LGAHLWSRRHTIARQARSFFVVLLPLFVIAHFSHHLVSAVFTPLLPYIRETLAIDYTRTGLLVAAFNISYGVGQFPGGWLADRWGFARLVTIGISGVALCGILAGLSPSFWFLAAVLGIMGVLGGGYHPAASPLISTRVAETFRGRALGIHQTGGSASWFLAPLIAGGIAEALGWRGAFLAVSVPTLLFGLLLYILLNRNPSEEISSETEEDEGGVMGRLGSMLPVMLLSIINQFMVFSVLTFVPLFIVDHLGGSKAAGAVMLSIANSAGLWAGLLGGFLSDRIGKVPIIVAPAVIAGPLIYLLGQATLAWSIYPVLLLLGMSQYMVMPVTESYLITHSPKKRRSTFMGLYYALSRGGPGLAAPVIGILIDRYRFQTAFLAVAGFMVAVLLGCSLIILLNAGRRPRP
jgi:FSR family fosmidomycin resistance protein-like MFS transporter